jgi:hypothetical protein
MPEPTSRVFGDHGEIGRPLTADAGGPEKTLRAAEAVGIDLAAITAELELSTAFTPERVPGPRRTGTRM